MDPTKIQAVLSLKNKEPKTVGEVRHLLGLLGYYRRYIRDFSRVTKPLFDLLQRSNEPNSSKIPQVPSSQTVSWTNEHGVVLNQLLERQGREFENKLFHQLEKSCGIIRSSYHPQGNGKAEMFNRTLLSMLKTLPENQKNRWDQHVSKAVHAYNCTTFRHFSCFSAVPQDYQ